MKLLNSDLSPYAGRVRIYLRMKGLAVDIVPPDVPLRTVEFLQKYPFGKIPLLINDDGGSLAESWSIMQYLETCYPEPPLQPADNWQQAQMNARGRFADTHLAPAAFPLFGQLMGRGQVDLQAQIEAIKFELGKADVIWRQIGALPERAVDLADIALLPVLYFVLALPKLLGYPHDLLSGFPALQHWWLQMQQIEAVKLSLTELENAFKAMSARSA
ncbi:glutathione S-transferase family protein [Rheinheimera mangrovi]|uniref:glutathione S-transferase family protein n=1 Tax=Rheinheimera mangrovi TaxID=2498451 RepID=UPI000F8EB15F|nr:glutathione S-transferase family protein [Rheinheimera mangrovi]